MTDIFSTTHVQEYRVRTLQNLDYTSRAHTAISTYITLTSAFWCSSLLKTQAIDISRSFGRPYGYVESASSHSSLLLYTTLQR